MKNFLVVLILATASCGVPVITKSVRTYRVPPYICRVRLPDSVLAQSSGISRGEVAYILITRFNAMGILNLFPPSEDINPEDVGDYWAEDYIESAVDRKLMRCMPDQNFYPHDQVKKFQICIIFYRILQMLSLQDIQGDVYIQSWEWAIRNHILSGERDHYLTGPECIQATMNFANYLLDN
ncbi:MAG: hypothetical protein APR63_11295 [Desulfuromonas sp. SDB]|nr:MAG: hypothetical protein APR63_11295 [Desulfuromonas sp. SDB]